MASLYIFRQHWKIQEKLGQILNTFENIMENGAYAPKEQMLHFS